MKYEHMTFSEIRRLAEPTTELERVLLERFERELESEIEESEAKMERDDEDMLAALEQDFNEAKERIEYLEELLDEHEIKYNK